MLQNIGKATISWLQRLGKASLFLWNVIIGLPSLIIRPRLVLAQVYSAGVLSLLIIIVSGFFVGMVLGLQGYNTLIKFGSEKSLGILVALSLVRELGPVITALLFAGRAGSALTSEIGLMKSTEQLSGMEMMAVDPIKRIIAPRFLACIISVPILTAIFNATGILGGHFVAVDILGVDDGAFWSQMQSSVSWSDDVVNGLIKSLVFGVIIGWIAVFEGYDTIPTSSGMSRSTTRSVVHNSLIVLGLDFVLTALMF